MTAPKVYLITGCSSGLGYCLAQAALATGAKVIATARNPEKNVQIYDELKNARAAWETLDVSSPECVLQMQDITSKHGRVDVLINNAGIEGSVRPIEEQSVSDAYKVFETNVWGPMRTAQAIIPIMREQKSGCIVNISSASVFDLLPGIAVYAASKAALDAMTGSLAAEVAPFGVKVILVTPADIRTPFVDKKKAGEMLPSLGDAYADGPVKMAQDFVQALDGKQTIDPTKAAARIIEAAEKSASYSGSAIIRLPIGSNAGKSIRKWIPDYLDQIEQTESVWKSVDYPECE